MPSSSRPTCAAPWAPLPLPSWTGPPSSAAAPITKSSAFTSKPPRSQISSAQLNPQSLGSRDAKITAFLRQRFPISLWPALSNPAQLRLGFDVAASGKGDLACIYIDEAKGDELWLRALFTCRTEDWHFLTTVLYTFLRHLPYIQAAGDETGLGRQICWTAAQDFPSRFITGQFQPARSTTSASPS